MLEKEKKLNNEETSKVTGGSYEITNSCIKCGACAAQCPMNCIREGEDRFIIDGSKCIDCGGCAGVCPTGAARPQ